MTFDNVLIMAATEAATVSELLNPCPNPGRVLVPIRGPLATATTPRIRPRGSGGGVRAQSLTGEALVAKGLTDRRASLARTLVEASDPNCPGRNDAEKMFFLIIRSSDTEPTEPRGVK